MELLTPPSLSFISENLLKLGKLLTNFHSLCFYNLLELCQCEMGPMVESSNVFIILVIILIPPSTVMFLRVCHHPHSPQKKGKFHFVLEGDKELPTGFNCLELW
jgi:hypothetical protein